MGRRSAATVLLLFCFAAMAPPVLGSADPVEMGRDMYSALDENGRAAADSAETVGGYDLRQGLSSVLSIARDSFMPMLSSGIRTASKLMAVTLTFSLAGSLFKDREPLTSAIDLCVTSAVAVTSVSDVTSALNTAIEYQNRLTEFSKVLLPALTAAGAASGTGGEALMLRSGAALFCDLGVSAYSALFVPFVFVFIGVRLCGSLWKNSLPLKLADRAKDTVMAGIKLFLMLFVGYMTLAGIAGSAADSLALRSAKTAASAVPYVGGVAAEAVDAVAAGAFVIKGYLGVFGAVGILGSAVIPLLTCGLGWGCVKLAALLSSALPFGAEAVNTVAEAMGLVFSMCAASTMLMLLSVMTCVGAVSL